MSCVARYRSAYDILRCPSTPGRRAAPLAGLPVEDHGEGETMTLLVALLMLAVIAMCGAVTYLAWEAARTQKVLRATFPKAMAALFGDRDSPPPIDPAHR